MAFVADPPPYVHLSVPNRSLGVAGRRWVLAGIVVTTLGIASVATAFGAWPVMPFAGIEVALVALAFHVFGRHDADFERLEVSGDEVRLEVRDARQTTRFVAHRPWARLLVHERGPSCTLGLAYAGRTVPLGRLMSDEERRRFARELRGRLALR